MIINVGYEPLRESGAVLGKVQGTRSSWINKHKPTLYSRDVVEIIKYDMIYDMWKGNTSSQWTVVQNHTVESGI